jgi:hypothetical protein
MIFHVTIAETTRCAWSSIVTHNRHSLCSAFRRDLHCLQRVRYVNIFQLSQLWYQTKILRTVNEDLPHINSAMAWYIWSGSIFRVPLLTLYLEPR